MTEILKMMIISDTNVLNGGHVAILEKNENVKCKIRLCV